MRKKFFVKEIENVNKAAGLITDIQLPSDCKSVVGILVIPVFHKRPLGKGTHIGEYSLCFKNSFSSLVEGFSVIANKEAGFIAPKNYTLKDFIDCNEDASNEQFIRFVYRDRDLIPKGNEFKLKIIFQYETR